MQPAFGLHQIVPRPRPRRPRAHHGTGAKALAFGPRKLTGAKFTLGGTIGEIQAHRNGNRLHRLVQKNDTFHFMVDFPRVIAHGERAVAVEAAVRFDEKNRLHGRRVAEFNGVFCEGSDGAPHRHASLRLVWFINNAMPKDDSLQSLPLTMANEWNVRKRRPVRRKHIAPLLKRLESDLAIDLNVDGAFLEMAEYGPWTMVFVDRTPIVIELLDEAEERCVFLTLRGFLGHMDALKWVEVDHGAIPFLMNGADCMVAGVHGAEPSVQSGDLVWIRDMTHKRPLALGWAVDDAKTLVENTKGKGIKTVHWVGDELWEME